MSFDLPNSAVEQLKGFILLCRTKPEILHKPELKFFRDFLESFGANLPTPPPEEKTDKPAEQGKPKQAEQENMETEVFANITGIGSILVYDFLDLHNVEIWGGVCIFIPLPLLLFHKFITY